MTKSLPNLLDVLQVQITEEDVLREAAEEALNYLYDAEVEAFYVEAREKASSLRKRSIDSTLE